MNDINSIINKEIKKDAIAKTIHTGVFSKKAYTILNRFKDFLENYASTNLMNRNGALLKLEFGCNNEVLLNIIEKSQKHYYAYYSNSSYPKLKTNEQALEWFALQLKKLTVLHYNNWSRDNTKNIDFLSDFKNHIMITVQDVYCLYDIFLNRKHINKHYTSELISEMKGEELNFLESELNHQYHEELEILRQTTAQELKTLTNNRDKEWFKMSDAFGKKTNEMKQLLIDMFNSKKRELAEKFNVKID